MYNVRKLSVVSFIRGKKLFEDTDRKGSQSQQENAIKFTIVPI